MTWRPLTTLIAVCFAAAFFTAPITIRAQTTYVWTNGSGTWSNASAWTNNAAPTNGSALIFRGAGGFSTNALLSTVDSLAFSNTTGSLVLTSSGLVSIGAGGVANFSSNAHTIGMNLQLATNTTFNAASNDLTFTRTLGYNSFLLTVTGNRNTFFNADTTGGTSLEKTGAGTLIVTGILAHTGGTLVSAGSLQVGDGGTNGVIRATTNNASLVFNRSDNVTNGFALTGTGNLTKLGAGTLTLTTQVIQSGGALISDGALVLHEGSLVTRITNSSSLIINRAANLTQSNAITGTGNLTKLGFGTLTLMESNVQSGTLVSAGALQVGDGGTSGSIASDITNNASLLFNRSDNLSQSNTITGTGRLTKLGAGTLTLTASNTYEGGTLISAGALRVGSGGTNNGSLVGRITNNSALIFDRALDLTHTSSITGTGTLTKTNAGTLTLTASNAQGGTTIAQGALQLGDGGTNGLLASAITNNATLIFNRSDSLTHSNAISGTGRLTKLGAGTVTLSGSNSYNGGTLISDGTLQIGDGGTNGSLAGRTTNNGSLIFNSSGSLSITGAITGTGSLTKLGTGTVTLSGSNTYDGGTLIGAGALQLGAGGSTGSLLGPITNNGSLIFDRSDTLVVSNAISGSGNLIKTNFTGTLTLTASNTYSGGTTVGGGTLRIGEGGTDGWITGPITNNGTLVFNRSDDNIVTSSITGIGILNKLGAGTLTLAASNAQGNGTLVSAGTLQIGTGGTNGALSSSITNNGTLVFNRSDNLIHAAALANRGQITGTGTLIKLGAGTLTLLGTNSQSGTFISDGTLRLGNDGGGSPGVDSSLSGPITNNGTLFFDGYSDTWTMTNPISGTGRLRIEATFDGIVNLTASNTYAGGTFVGSRATLRVGSGGSNNGSLVGSITNNGTLVFNRLSDLTVGAITGTGTLIKSNAGVITITGASTQVGTMISQGTLQIGDGGTNGSFGGVITNFGVLAFDRSDNLTHTSAFTGAGTLRKSGAGTLTMTANSSSAVSLTTAVDAGRLVVNGTNGNSGDDLFRTTVAAGASLAGSGRVNTISGAGSVDPGNSPGILTTPSVMPTNGLSFNFEFTGIAPVFSNATASLNDVLRLTNLSLPFVRRDEFNVARSASLTLTNTVNVYFNVDTLTNGQTYTGGFFTDATADFLSQIANANFNYFLKDAGGTNTYEGQTYSELQGLTIDVTTIAQSANFAGGTVNGRISQFEVVPEPSTYALLLMTGAGALYAWGRRRRSNTK